MSGQSGSELREEAIHLGCIDFIQKPFTLSELAQQVSRILSRPARVA
jgi:DNA-binding NtrC family response regulator